MSALPKKQTSRKGKKAWRKNVDIADVSAGLEASRDRERVMGNLDTDPDFIIDHDPDASAPVAVRPLKTAEILANKSRVPALNPKHTPASKQARIRRTDLLRLVKLTGGKYKEESRTNGRIENDGIVRKLSSSDIWGEPEPAAHDPTANFTSTTEYTAPSKPPQTISKAPRTIKEFESVAHAGKSYNPSLELWKALIGREHSVENKHEQARQQAQSHRERIAHLMETLQDQTGFSSSEEESDGEQDLEDADAQDPTDYSLSINKPTKINIKTKSKRNQIEKHKHQQKLGRELKELKAQLQDLTNLELIMAAELERQARSAVKAPVSLRQRNLFKYDVTYQPLEVKLSLELTNNLKNLKPEGNLLYDQMASLQLSGKIESRIPVAKRRKYTKKVTEKWTYKDFK